MTIVTHRIYNPIPPEYEGYRRILVDKLWPRGISKQVAQLDYWCKDVAPSNELRNWYQHDHQKWETFRERYSKELQNHEPGIQMLIEQMGEGPVVFLFASKEAELNNATALKQYLEGLL